MELDFKRILFLCTVISILFAVKLFIAYHMLSPIVYPDELTYGFRNKNQLSDWNSISNFSIYSYVPEWFGYNGSLIFNSFITSACALPLFYLFRKFQDEFKASVLTVLVSLFSPLWVYSFVNMTEALLFFLVLNSALLFAYRNDKTSSISTALVKPTGIALILTHVPFGFYIALVGGLVFAMASMSFTNDALFNGFMSILRSFWYILFASFGMAFFTGYRVLTGQGDKYDEFVLKFLAVTFAIVFGFMFRLPHEKFYGRYFDAPILLLFTTALKPFDKRKMFKPAFIGVLCLAFVYPVLTGFAGGGVLDAGAMFFVSAVKQVLWLSNPAFPQP